MSPAISIFYRTFAAQTIRAKSISPVGCVEVYDDAPQTLSGGCVVAPLDEPCVTAGFA